MFRALEPWHLIVLVAVIALLFGSKRLPDAARGLGQSMRIFKSEMTEMKKKDEAEPAKPSSAPAPLEGRVVDGEATGRVPAPSERRNDA
jgi:sec-independent protein translocase protein TatA